MTKRTKLGAAGATVLRRRTGAEALAAATTTAGSPARRGLDGYKVTTIRFTDPQWMWLRRQALERAIADGTRGDASEIVRELVANAMKAKGAAR